MQLHNQPHVFMFTSKLRFIILVCIMCLPMVGCYDNTTYRHIKQYSNGTLIGEWTTQEIGTGNFKDGYSFIDIKTGQRVDISGDIQVFTMK